MTEAYIRPLAICPPNMTLKAAEETHVLICAWEWGAYLGEKLLRVMLSSYQRPNPKAFKIESKAAGLYVNSILASQEAKSKGYDEALLLDIDGFVAEGPGANLFYEKDGTIYTPAKGNILPGITRATVIEICQELGIPWWKTNRCRRTVRSRLRILLRYRSGSSGLGQLQRQRFRQALAQSSVKSFSRPIKPKCWRKNSTERLFPPDYEGDTPCLRGPAGRGAPSSPKSFRGR